MSLLCFLNPFVRMAGVGLDYRDTDLWGQAHEKNLLG